MRARAKKKKISRCARRILSLGKEIREATSTKYKLLVCAEPSHFKSPSPSLLCHLKTRRRED